MDGVVILWLAAGIFGAGLLWADHKMERASMWGERIVWGPTPRAILFFVVASALGPLILGVGISAIGLSFFLRINNGENWFTRPICQSTRIARAKREVDVPNSAE